MEYGLGPGSGLWIGERPKKCLNPCFNGIWSRTAVVDAMPNPFDLS